MLALADYAQSRLIVLVAPQLASYYATNGFSRWCPLGVRGFVIVFGTRSSGLVLSLHEPAYVLVSGLKVQEATSRVQHAIESVTAKTDLELGLKMSLLERCPHFRGCYVQASMELGLKMSLLERCPHF